MREGRRKARRRRDETHSSLGLSRSIGYDVGQENLFVISIILEEHNSLVSVTAVRLTG